MINRSVIFVFCMCSLVFSFAHATEVVSAADKLSRLATQLSTDLNVKIKRTDTALPFSELESSKFVALRQLGFDGSLMQLPVIRTSKHTNGARHVLAEKETDGELTRAIMTYYGDVLMARVVVNNQAWSIVQYGDKQMRYLSRDLPDLTEHEPVEKAREQMSLSMQQAIAKDELPAGEMVTLDLYGYYEQEAVELYGQDGVIARIAHVVDFTNQIYRDSGIYAQLNILHLTWIDDTRWTENNGDHTSVYAAAKLDWQRRGADFVTRFSTFQPGDGFCGLGRVISVWDPEPLGLPLSTVNLNCDDNVLAHEIGHNMGLKHSRRQDRAGGTFPYALGHGVEGVFNTIMAYPSAYGYPPNDIPLFSSPELDCVGQPCGVDRNDPNGADAVLAINKLRHLYQSAAERNENVSGVPVTVSADGEGMIRDLSGTLDCGASTTCGGVFPEGSRFTLVAEPFAGQTFEGWGGSCRDFGRATECQLEPSDASSAVAYFSRSAPVGIKRDKKLNSRLINEAIAGENIVISGGHGRPPLYDVLDLSWTTLSHPTINAPGADDTVVRSPIAHILQDFTQPRGVPYNYYIEVTLPAGAGVLGFWARADTLSSDKAYMSSSWPEYVEMPLENDGRWHYYEYEFTEQFDAASRQVGFVYQDNSTEGYGRNGLLIDDISFTPAEANTNRRVNIAVNGTGRIELMSATGRVDDVICPGDCFFYAEVGSTVRLKAAPGDNKSFVGWGGSCVTTERQCELSIEPTTELTATFDDAPAQRSAALGDWLDNDELVFSVNHVNDTGAVWQQDTTQFTQGESSASINFMKPIEGYASIGTVLEGSGELTFDWRVDASSYVYDDQWTMALYVNDQIVEKLHRYQPWTTQRVQLGEGTHHVEWRFEHSFNGVEFNGEANLDHVRWTGSTPNQPAKLRLDVSGQGAVSASQGVYCTGECATTLNKGEITLLAQPMASHRFYGWQGACSGYQQQCQLTLTGETSVQAHFAEDQGSLVATRGDEGVSFSPTQLYLGDSATGEIEVLVDDGYELTSVSGCNGRLQGQTFVVGPVTDSCDLIATTERKRYRVNFELGDYGVHRGDVSLTQDIEHGEAALAPQVEAVDNWHFAGWDRRFDEVTEALNVAALYQQTRNTYAIQLTLEDGLASPLEPTQYVAPGDTLKVDLYTTEPTPPDVVYAKGSCRAGDWLSLLSYRTGEVNRSCSLSFSLTRPVQVSSGALMLIMAVEAGKKESRDSHPEDK